MYGDEENGHDLPGKEYLDLTGATSAVFGFYFFRMFKILTGGEMDKTETLIFFVSAIVLLIIIEVVAHIFLTVVHRPETIDERDRLIELKATRIAYFFLVLGVFLTIGSIMMSLSPFMTAHIMLLSFVIAEMAKSISQLIYYRRGV